MARGGKRAGAGRKPGVPNKVSSGLKELAGLYTEEAVGALVHTYLEKWVWHRRIFRALSACLKGKCRMGYHLYYTDSEILEAQYRTRKLLLLSYAYNELDGALRKARQIREHGGVPWEIECDDGRVIRRYEIAKLLREREAELLDCPKVY